MSGSPHPAPPDPTQRLSEELRIPAPAIRKVVTLLSDGATVPFLARYRKEATGGLDEVQIREVAERHAYLVDLEKRRETVLGEIEKQGKLTPDLRRDVLAAKTKAELEDVYLPYKPKRRTRATIARERGLEPLADLIASQPKTGDPASLAACYVARDAGIADVDAALAGARDIIAERVAEDAELRRAARASFLERGTICVTKTREYADKPTKFDTYSSFEQSVRAIPSHRFLAIRRGESQGVLRVALSVDTDPLLDLAERRAHVSSRSPFAKQLSLAIRDAITRLLLPSAEVDVRVELKLSADRAAMDVFAANLRELLLSPPFGSRRVLGIDPGQRTGCKCVVVDETGKLLARETLFLVQGAQAIERSRRCIEALCREHRVQAVGVGNGTHGRETEQFVRAVLREEGLTEVLCVSVNESGASVYSASDVAREEFPDLDVSLRGAISIARRLQDPLAELVKIDPKSIGVGQYQHDVHQQLLAKKLDDVVESCVNSVGVELNTASAPLLARVAGLGPAVAKKIVHHRDAHGAFRGRRDLLAVPGLGPKTFEQAAGFLRIRDASNPLDASSVHPERYLLVEQMARDLGVGVATLVGNPALVDKVDRARYVGSEVGQFTLDDIIDELKKPGRDPRATFDAPSFRDDVRSLDDVQPGMELEGVVTNVTAFGAFVDVGVHQDGLVHVSELADRFVKDPGSVVKVGDRVKARVLQVDRERGRISLSLRSGARPDAGATVKEPVRQQSRTQDRKRGSVDGSGRHSRAGTADQFRFTPFSKLKR